MALVEEWQGAGTAFEKINSLFSFLESKGKRRSDFFKCSAYVCVSSVGYALLC
jgi:hypothetical protein